MKFSLGYEVAKSEDIHEEYQIMKRQIFANVSVEHMEPVLKAFIEAIEEPCFFILELPMNEAEEKKLRKQDTDPYHRVVYYIDGCTKEKLLYILASSGELLIQDGMSSFGFASHKTKDEIFVGKYNVVTIYSKKPKKFTGLLEKFGIKRTKELITAWNTFSETSFGCCKGIELHGTNVYALPELYEGLGIYRAEVREE
ncbi:MAG: hypothetical protein K2N65_06795 [Anaeroplasmataceae bacterium]|nr:hypothetical protein [Anaeroplasmataceae bacterium]